MNWIRENKFLTGLLGVTVVGAGILLFLLMGALSQYKETSTAYEQETAELKRLQALKPYPEDANFSKLTAQKEEHSAEVQKLRTELSAMELPKESISPEQFQDSLRSKVSEIEALAAENNVALPEGFYLGFPTYQGSPPRGEATERLGWQLRVIESFVRGVINAKVTSIDSIERQALPEESRASASSAKGRGGNEANSASRNQADKAPQPELVSRFPFTIAMTGEQSRIRAVLNQIANTKEQFLIARTLKIENEQTVGPSKAGALGPDGAAPASAADSASLEALLGSAGSAELNQAVAKKLQFILGSEKLKVVVTIDIVDFAESAADESKQAGRN